MARYTGPILKKARAYGIEPTAMGINKESKRNPRVSMRKKSEYGRQLNEKQKAKFIYGVLEKPFRKLYHRASKMPGQTGWNLLKLLEMRFDNVVYRMGFAQTRAQARQLIVHNHFRVNGKKVDIPSYTMEVGDVISVKEKSKNNGMFKDFKFSQWGNMPWVEVDDEKLEGRIIAEPTRENIDYEIEEQMIVELYSK